MTATESKPVRTRKPPRPPQSWSWDAAREEVTITDCDGKPEVYRVLPVAADWGRAFELINVGARFGTSYYVHLDAELGHSCDCPGHCFTGRCKHSHALAALVADGTL